MYPSDNSVIVGQKYQVSDDFFYRYKVLKEGVIFGIKENSQYSKFSQFWALLDSNSRFIVELERDEAAIAEIEAELREKWAMEDQQAL